MVNTLGTTLGEQKVQIADMNQSLSTQGGIPARVQQFSGNVTPVVSTLLLQSKTHSSDSFDLGHSTKGVLGTDTLGGTLGAATVLRVLNKDNTFEDHFDTTRFIDSVNSTGARSSTAYTYELTTNEILQSEVVAMNNKAYTRATLSVSGTNTSVTSGEISFNGGTSWQSASYGVGVIAGSTTVDGVKYRITGLGVVHSFTMDSPVVDSSNLDKRGVKITMNTTATVHSLTKASSCTASKAYIYRVTDDNLMGSALFSGDDAVLNVELVSGSSYYFVADDEGPIYDSIYDVGTPSFSFTEFDVITGVSGQPGSWTSPRAYHFNIEGANVGKAIITDVEVSYTI